MSGTVESNKQEKRKMAMNMTAHEQATVYFNSLTPMQRYEIMRKVEYSKSSITYYRRCIAYIVENKKQGRGNPAHRE